MTGRRAKVDADAIAQLWTLGHCLGARTLMSGIERLQPGTAYRFSAGASSSRAWEPIEFSEDRRANANRLAQQLNGALIETLEAHRARVAQVTSALSSGMDSRYVLAGARRVWPSLDSYTFGESGSADARFAAALARRAGIAHRLYAPQPDFLPRWAPYAVWRSDGLLNCVHAQGMDATIAHAERVPDILNGIGGDFLMGAFLRPGHLFSAADPGRAARFILASRRFHRSSLDQILKPELFAQLGAPVESELRAQFELDRSRRFGNMLLGYWLRRYAPHITTIGLMLEEPWVEWIAPMIDPHVISAIAGIPLELRFMGRLYRRALAQLAPELTTVRWDRTGVAPRWPWPLHAGGRYARRFGLLPRSRPAVDHAHAMRTFAAPWLRETLLSARTRADGFFQPAFLEEIVSEHVDGGINRASEIGLAITLELWRRMYAEGEGFEGTVGA
jgi:asparagine synthase (glutamine-hydrolysing)